MHVIIIGNGILGLSIAHGLVKRDGTLRATIVGPENHRGCASLAAAAMLNSYCEIDGNTLGNPFERAKFLFNKAATPFWPATIAELEEQSGCAINHGFGTFLVNNHSTDSLEDANFDAIKSALVEFGEPFEEACCTDIANYKPQPMARAARAIFIPGEGWINPIELIAAYKAVLHKSCRVNFIDAMCQSVSNANGSVSQANLACGRELAGDAFVLAPGANFSKIVADSALPLSMPRIFYGIGCSILLQTGTATLPKCVRTPNRGLACGVYAAPQSAAQTIVGASNFISPEPEDFPRITSVHTLLKAAMEQINSDYYRAQLVRVNLGWRPTSEDTLPLIGKTSLSNLYVATGTKRDGLHCSPLIAKCISEQLLCGTSDVDVSLFKPERKPVRVLKRYEAVEMSVRHTLNAAYQHGFVAPHNRMVDELESYYRGECEALHDKVGAHEWGIPPEMLNMYRYGHAR